LKLDTFNQVSGTLPETANLVKGGQLSEENSLSPELLNTNMYTSWHTRWTKTKLVQYHLL